MTFDCAVIGGGPAGANAALVLLRGKKKVIMFDDDNARNSVTTESHNFITQDGAHPAEFREKAYKNLHKYPGMSHCSEHVKEIIQKHQTFQIITESEESYETENIILSTGLKDVLPDIKGIHDVYGTSVFSCPFCDGYELSNEPIVYLANDEHTFHAVKVLSNWNNDITICTNNKEVLTLEQIETLNKAGIQIIEDEIQQLHSSDGNLNSIEFKNGQSLNRSKGFVSYKMEQSSPLYEKLGLTLNDTGGIQTDIYGRTNINGVYAAGDNAAGPPQLIIASAAGSKAAIGIIMDNVEKKYN